MADEGELDTPSVEHAEPLDADVPPESMSHPASGTISEVRGVPYRADMPALFTLTLSGCPKQVRADIDLAFVANPIALDAVIMDLECYIACTGFRVDLESNGSFRDWHRGPTTTTAHELTAARVGSLEASHSGAKAGTTHTTGEKITFPVEEAALVATPLTKTSVRWTYHLHRGGNAHRNYLEGPFPLFGVCERPQERLTFKVEARATDCRIFGPDRRALGALATMAVRVFYATRSKPWPSVGPVILTWSEA
jgi:hypothetical protein